MMGRRGRKQRDEESADPVVETEAVPAEYSEGEDSVAREQPVAAEPTPELRDEAQEQAVEEPAPEPDAATEAAAPDLRGTTEVPADVPQVGEAPEPDAGEAPEPEVGETPEPEPPIDAETIDSAEPVAAPPTGPDPEDAPFTAPEPAEPDHGPGVEILVGAAFAGGLALAILLRRLRS
jgi:hypothetical protein